MLCHTESAKSQAASSGLCQSLVNVIQSPVDSPAVKLASDVLVSVLVGDESMDALFAHGDGPLYQQCVQWLSSHRDSLQTLGCLAIGNFARRGLFFCFLYKFFTPTIRVGDLIEL